MSINNDIQLLIEWADKSMCYSWLHNNAYHHYSYKDKLFTIPSIIMTTIAGTSAFANIQSLNDIGVYLSMGIGGITMFSGLLTTLKKFLKITELSESHRLFKMNWEKLNREIRIHLTRLDNSNNITPEYIEKIINKFEAQYNHLMETSPVIPNISIKEFNKEFSKSEYSSIKKPEICGNLENNGYFVNIN